MSRQDRERLGLNQALEACLCLTPQGRRLKAKHSYHGPESRPLLETELAAVENLAAFIKHHPAAVRQAEILLRSFKDLRGTLAGLARNRLLDLAELFEIKEAVALFHSLMKESALLDKAGLSLAAVRELEALLDPRGLQTSGFYLYDDYSAALASLREERRLIEEKLEEGGGTDRPALLVQRRDLVDREAAEEALVRRNLSDIISPWHKELESNFETVGLLDFRLAKAHLTLAWGASRPDLLDQGSVLVLEGFHHPVISEHLVSRGAVYQRQTLTLAPGTTVLTGANMGGKSVALKAMTLSLVLVHLGYFPPAEYAAVPLFDFISYSSDYLDTTRRGLSTLAAELVRIREDARLAREKVGLTVIDEPFRGTNPEEAGALIGALCRFYAGLTGSLVLATHYRTPQGQGIRHLRLAGLVKADLEEIIEGSGTGLGDDEAIRRIESLMDYSIEVVDGSTGPPDGAVRLARWLGLDGTILEYLED